MLTRLRFSDWIKTLGCIICGAYGTDPHHVNMEDGKTRRFCDEGRLVPLCRVCHDLMKSRCHLEKKFKLKEKAIWLYNYWLSIKI